mmetsp:Transcript_6766/g.13914  ORF Transcript_6766/g.13914 Transcript_6766/m.13914 type:complete len:92 (+) Transcript_6766:296-571(+)
MPWYSMVTDIQALLLECKLGIADSTVQYDILASRRLDKREGLQGMGILWQRHVEGWRSMRAAFSASPSSREACRRPPILLFSRTPQSANLR